MICSETVQAQGPFNKKLAVGGTIGMTYNRNRLKAPYVFQSHPVLKGLKVLTSLDADDIGLNATLGMDYRFTDDIILGVAYSFETDFNASGRLGGNLAQLGLPVPSEFNYKAKVETAVPRSASFSAVWQGSPMLKLGFQVDWINWRSAFAELPLHLANGDNAALNAFLGSDTIDDTVPLDWRDQYIFHFGSAYRWSGNLSLRAGYQFGGSPVPVGTLTPLTAAITEHAVSFGLGYENGDYALDLAYRWSLPNTERVENSILLGGEFNNSHTRVGTHWFGFSIRL